jgi:hypothetical protein
MSNEDYLGACHEKVSALERDASRQLDQPVAVVTKRGVKSENDIHNDAL